MEVLPQDSFAGGIFRAAEGERAPTDSIYDCVNGLLDEQGAVYRRGGSAYKGTAAPLDLHVIADVNVAAGQRTVFWGASSGLHVFAADDATPVTVDSLVTGRFPARAVGVGGYVAIPTFADNGGGAYLYAGSRKTANYSTGTASTTSGSKTVTGSGTAWLANADAGMIFTLPGLVTNTVASVDSDTQLTLRDNASATWAGAAYTLQTTYAMNATHVGVTSSQARAVAAVGSPARLVLTFDNRAFFSTPGDPFAMDSTNFHELPSNSLILGADNFRDNLVLFTTDGVWVVQNMNLDPVDDFGNVQHTVQQINKDVILWGNAGVAAWAGTLLVPALDDVYLLSLNEPPVRAPEPISGPISSLYRSYVADGCYPGGAVVYRAHYLLPILKDGVGIVDTLVCRLDSYDSRGNRRPAWTRWAGQGGSSWAMAARIGTTAPKLFGVAGTTRVLDLTGTFAPTASNISDADGTTHSFTVTTRGYTAHRAISIQWKKLRARVTATAATGVTAETTSDYSTYTTVSTKTIDPTGATTSTWPVNKRRRMIAFRFSAPAPTGGKVALRGLELFYRQTGDQ